jgi:hypothetical protein
MKDDVTLDLQGDFHRDIRGTVIRIHNPEPAERRPGYMEGFKIHHTGRVGDMTAGLEPRDYVEYPYLEFYSDQNGRVVLELDRDQLQVIGTPRPWREEQPVSREEQQRNLGEWLGRLCAELGGVPAMAVQGEPGQTTSAQPQTSNKEEREKPTTQVDIERSDQVHEPGQDQDHEYERDR